MYLLLVYQKECSYVARLMRTARNCIYLITVLQFAYSHIHKLQVEVERIGSVIEHDNLLEEGDITKTSLRNTAATYQKTIRS